MKMKKMLCMLLAVVMACSMCVSTAFAFDFPSFGDLDGKLDDFIGENTCEHGDWEYTSIADSGTHTKACGKCDHLSGITVEACNGCERTGGCTLCGSELKDIHMDANADTICDLCGYPTLFAGIIDWKHDETNHWGEVIINDNEIVKYLENPHEWSEWGVTKEATEDAEGEETRSCSVCGRVETKSIDKLPHTHKYVDTVIAPTCEAEGYTEKACPCGDTQKVDIVEKLGHNFGEWETTVEATEDAEGEQKRTCTNGDCTEFETQPIDKLPHVHKYDFDEKVVEPTCTEKGYTEQFCKCGDSQKVNETDLIDHSFGDWFETKAATMTEEGEEKRECQADGCDEFETRKTDKLPHVCTPDNKLSDVVEATCEEDGFSGNKRCIVCKEILEEGKVVEALGHKEIKVKKVEPTCTKDGKEEGVQCETCKKVLKEGDVIKALGHKFPAENDKNGKKLCERCGVDKNSPQTGDASNLFFWGILMVASLMGGVAIIRSEKKRAKAEE